jgi:hypothetical protein
MCALWNPKSLLISERWTILSWRLRNRRLDTGDGWTAAMNIKQEVVFARDSGFGTWDSGARNRAHCQIYLSRSDYLSGERAKEWVGLAII